MPKLIKSGLLLSAVILMMSALSACNQVDDDRIPSLPVYINLSGAGMWNSYGVPGVGFSQRFINYEGERSPAGFPYNANTYVGYGGVLLIGGIDPFTGDTNVPLPYDLSCPVERSRTVRVFIDSESLEAVCPVCGSHYDVLTAGGTPTSGPALTGKHKYALRRYQADIASGGGYIIHN